MIKYFIALCLMSFTLNSFAYWSCAWPYRTELNIQENSGTTLSNYQVKVTISGSNLNAAYNWTTNGFDLRLVDSDDETLLNFWVESWNQATETATVWVKLNTLTANQNRRIYVYYGNEFADQLANVPFTFTEPGIKFHTRQVNTDPNSLAQAQSLFDAASDNVNGYGCTFVTNFTGVRNGSVFGNNSNFIAYSETYFEVQAGEEGTWGVRYGGDFGGGGGLYVNGNILEEQWNDNLWWGNNWGRAGEVLQGSINLTAGFHKLEVIGQENCCDGGITVQFQRPGQAFVSYSTGAINIVSRECPISNEPTYSFGAQATSSCPPPLAQYRLDRGPWSGADDVRDQTGNFPGTMVGAATNELNTQVCNGFNVPNNTTLTEISALQTGVDVDTDVGAIGSIGFWVRTEENWNANNTRRTFMDASLFINGNAGDRYFFLEKLGDGRLSFRFEDSADGDFTVTESSVAGRVQGQWYHITLTWDFVADEFNIYEGDTLIGTDAPSTSGAINLLGDIFIGDNSSQYFVAPGNSSFATFDEVTIYNSVLSISEIRGLIAKTRFCNVPLNVGSITVSAPPTGVNCLPSQVDIALFDTDGNLYSDYDDVINLTTNVSRGDWSTNGSEFGILNNASANDGAATYEMNINDGGDVSLLLSNTFSESTTLTVEADGISETATINFQASGFVFSNITNQIANVTSSIFSLQAVETDQVTGTCQSLLLNPTEIDLALECMAPTDCQSAIINVNTGSGNVGITTNTSGGGAPPLNYTNLDFNFGGTSTNAAPYIFNYSDAGSLRFNARYNLKDADGNNTGNTLVGTSNTFISLPAGFCIEPTDANWQCTTPSLTNACSAFKQAGDTFNLSVTAKRANGNSTDYCSHATTNNFTSSVNLSHNLIAPTIVSGGELSTFSLSSINLNAGTATSLARFNEMGVFTVTGGGNGYLGATLPINTSENIGRFYPKEFFIVSTTSAFYDNGNTGFTYIGQLESDGVTGAIGYASVPAFVFEARGANDQPLNNFLAPFYSAPVPTVFANSDTLGNIAAPPTELTVTAEFLTGTITGPDSNNRFTYEFNNNDHFRFNRTQDSLRSPFNNDIELTIGSLIEPVDGVDLASTIAITGSGGPIYYGRMRIENGYGPETEPVPQLIKAEYFNGTQFLFNALDSGTVYDLANINSISVTDAGNSSNNLAVGDSTISGQPTDTGIFALGLVNTRWSVPVSNRYGAYEFQYDADTWLMYDWNGSADGVDEDPPGIVNFGQFRGNDRVIYWKEINY